jgi:hypothetical protein
MQLKTSYQALPTRETSIIYSFVAGLLLRGINCQTVQFLDVFCIKNALFNGLNFDTKTRRNSHFDVHNFRYFPGPRVYSPWLRGGRSDPSLHPSQLGLRPTALPAPQSDLKCAVKNKKPYFTARLMHSVPHWGRIFSSPWTIVQDPMGLLCSQRSPIPTPLCWCSDRPELCAVSKGFCTRVQHRPIFGSKSLHSNVNLAL